MQQQVHALRWKLLISTAHNYYANHNPIFWQRGPCHAVSTTSNCPGKWSYGLHDIPLHSALLQMLHVVCRNSHLAFLQMLHVVCSNVSTADMIRVVRALIPALSCHALYADILTKVVAKAGCPNLILPSATLLQ